MYFGCIALGWLYIFMLWHKEIERLKINTYNQLPHFQLALVLVIDHHFHHHRHYHYYPFHFHYHRNRQCHLATQEQDGIKVFKLEIPRYVLDY